MDREAPPDEAPPDEAPPDEAPPDEAPPDEAPPDEAPPDEAPTMATAVACVIRVQGTVAPAGLARLGGLRLTAAGGAPAADSELRGELRDQAALHGVLLALHALGLPVRTVACTPVRHRPSRNGARTL